jgi:hypothetical protein
MDMLRRDGGGRTVGSTQSFKHGKLLRLHAKKPTAASPVSIMIQAGGNGVGLGAA